MYVLQLLFVVAVFLITPPLSWAETRSILGLSFEVDGIIPIDSQSTRLAIFDQSVLLDTDELDDTIVGSYCLHPESWKTLSFRSVVEFSERSLENENFTWAECGYLMALGARGSSLEGLRELLLQYRSESAERGALLAVLEKEGAAALSTDLLVELVLRAPADSAERISEDVLTKLEAYGGTVQLLFQEGVNSALRLRDLSELSTVTRNGCELVGPQDQLCISSRSLEQHFRTLRSALDAESLRSVGEALSVPLGDSIFIISAKLYQNELIQGEVRRRLDRKKYAEVLKLIQFIDLSARTPASLQVIQGAVDSLHGAELELLNDEQLWFFLSSCSQFDPALAATIFQKIAGLFEWAIGQNNTDILLNWSGRLSSLEFAVDPVLSRAIIAAALHLAKRGHREEAYTLIHHVGAQLSLIKRGQLALSGVYGAALQYTLWILFCVFLITVMLWSFSAFRRTQRVKLTAEQLPHEHGMHTQAPFRQRKYKSKELVEYEDALQLFSLTPTASLSEIKHAYRDCIKQVHPDNHGGDNTEKFQQFTEQYQRVLELRMLLGISDPEDDDTQG